MGSVISQVLITLFVSFFFHHLVPVKYTVYKHFYLSKACGLVDHSDAWFYMIDNKIMNLKVPFFNPYSKKSV